MYSLYWITQVEGIVETRLVDAKASQQVTGRSFLYHTTSFFQELINHLILQYSSRGDRFLYKRATHNALVELLYWISNVGHQFTVSMKSATIFCK